MIINIEIEYKKFILSLRFTFFKRKAMWNSSVSNPIYTTLNIISCIFDLMAILICFIFLYCISYRLIRMKYTQRQVSIDVLSILFV